MIILGINAYHGDVSAVLLRDGELVAAVEEERFTRVKHCAGFTVESIRTCLQMAGVTPMAVDHFAISRDPRANSWRKALFTVRRRPSPGLIWDRARNATRVQHLAETLAATLDLDLPQVRQRLHWVEHHPAHLASAFFVSPFETATVCAIDGFGDFVSTSGAIGRGSRLEMLERVYFPHSLGLLYLALTQYLGFRQYGDEYKVMGLAPYGELNYVEALRRLIHLKPGGGFELDLAYFRHHAEGVAMTWEDGEPSIGPVYTRQLERLLGPARVPEEPLEPRHEAIAASLQVGFEETCWHILTGLYQQTGISRLCLAGGCAMNSVMNGKIRTQTPFTEVYIQPAADNGTALGAALYVRHQVLGQPRHFVMDYAAWGPAFEAVEIEAAIGVHAEALTAKGCTIQQIDEADQLWRWTAERLAVGQIVG